MNITEKIQELKIVPVVVIKNIEDAEPTLKALCDGGLPVAEITLPVRQMLSSWDARNSPICS